ncbi:tyrosine-type recombinase/integrase [Halonotius sp. GCM10025705]|uniref:tyrosine-type recombinase/integrase n=1 Tax=Halonotius sp. GCM10025705 TaxID=3252678 RepID=UPI003619F801
MEPGTEDASPTPQPLEDAVNEFLSSGTKSGNYKSNLRSVLRKWTSWLADRGTTDLAGVDKRTMAKYAEHLQQRITAGQNPDVDGGISASTAWTYFDYISAFLDWCVEWDYIRENPAQKGIVKDELPERPTSDSGSQQFWSPEDREDLLAYVDEQAANAVDEKGLQAVVTLRDRALAYVLAYSGVRGGEILQDPRDDRRAGLRWKDVEIEASRATVLGKDQQREAVQLPEQTHQPLRQLRRVVDPPNEEWPVFPSNHAPSIHSALPDKWERPENDKQSLLDHCRSLGATPPALSTNGGRKVMKRICEDADLEIDGEYLKPHGGRRGAGETLYRELDAAAAQRALRHNDPATTSKMYSHIDATELAEDTSEAFKNTDS